MPSTYKDQHTTYTADRCKPLTQAVQQGNTKLAALARAGYPGTPFNNGILKQILSIGFWDAPDMQTWQLPTHRNEGIELTWLERGRLDFTVNDARFKLKPNDITITRPWQPHSLGDPFITPSRLHWLILDVDVRRPHQRWTWPNWLILTPDDLKHLTRLLSQNETPVFNADKTIADAFKKIAQCIESENPQTNTSRLTLLINQLFLNLLEMLSARKLNLEPQLTTSQRTVQNFLDQLKDDPQLLAQPWTTASLADHCGLGVTHFTHLCKKIANMTPAQFLTTARIHLAAQRIADTDAPITQIAFDCGFSSSQYFATVFTKTIGCPPRQYRSKHKKN